MVALQDSIFPDLTSALEADQQIFEAALLNCHNLVELDCAFKAITRKRGLSKEQRATRKASISQRTHYLEQRRDFRPFTEEYRGYKGSFAMSEVGIAFTVLPPTGDEWKVQTEAVAKNDASRQFRIEVEAHTKANLPPEEEPEKEEPKPAPVLHLKPEEMRDRRLADWKVGDILWGKKGYGVYTGIQETASPQAWVNFGSYPEPVDPLTMWAIEAEECPPPLVVGQEVLILNKHLGTFGEIFMVKERPEETTCTLISEAVRVTLNKNLWVYGEKGKYHRNCLLAVGDKVQSGVTGSTGIVKQLKPTVIDWIGAGAVMIYDDLDDLLRLDVKPLPITRSKIDLLKQKFVEIAQNKYNLREDDTVKILTGKHKASVGCIDHIMPGLMYEKASLNPQLWVKLNEVDLQIRVEAHEVEKIEEIEETDQDVDENSEVHQLNEKLQGILNPQLGKFYYHGSTKVEVVKVLPSVRKAKVVASGETSYYKVSFAELSDEPISNQGFPINGFNLGDREDSATPQQYSRGDTVRLRDGRTGELIGISGDTAAVKIPSDDPDFSFENALFPVAELVSKIESDTEPIPKTVINENGKDRLLISAIRRDGGTQPRVAVDRTTAEEYAQARRDGVELPPVIVFYDGREYWLGDGFHRVEAEEIVGGDRVLADIRQGTRRDAILYSVGANATHGLRRTNADKKRAVQTLLQDEEWAKWSNREIARRAGVDEKTVRNLRAEPSAENPQIEQKTVQRGSAVYTQQTTNIGHHSGLGASRRGGNGDPSGKTAPVNAESPKAEEQTPRASTSTSTTATSDPEPPKVEEVTPTSTATKPQKPQLEVFPRTAFISDNCPDDKLRGQTVTLISRPNTDLYLVDINGDRETVRACYVQDGKPETKTEQAIDFIVATVASLSNSQVDRLLKALLQNRPNAITALLNESNEEIAL